MAYSPVKNEIKRHIESGFNSLMSIDYNHMTPEDIENRVAKNFSRILDASLFLGMEEYASLKVYQKMHRMGDFYLENFFSGIIMLSQKISVYGGVVFKNKVIDDAIGRLIEVSVINYNEDINIMSSVFHEVLKERPDKHAEMFFSMLLRIANNYVNESEDYERRFFSEYVHDILNRIQK